MVKQRTAEIISTGTEIMLGLYPDTNAQRISSILWQTGISVLFHTATGDRRECLVTALKTALERAEIIIITGGLGPTEDDLTRSVVSELFQAPLQKDTHAEKMILEHFSKRKIPMPPSNLIQAMIPAKAFPIYNRIGTAPGFILHNTKRNKALIALPGPSREWSPMFKDIVYPFLKKHFSSQNVYKTLTLRTVGIPESEINERIMPLFKTIKGVIPALLAKPGKVDIRLLATASTNKKALSMLRQARSKVLLSIDSSDIYGESDTISLEEAVAKLLTSKGKTLSVAESCTGGLISKRLTDIAGSSAFFIEGALTYSNDAKIRRLCVSKTVLQNYGAVSGEVASEMARGVLSGTGADISVAVTGIAGPTGGTAEKPVGLVFFGLATCDFMFSCRKCYTGDRSIIRERAADYALELIRRYLLSA